MKRGVFFLGLFVLVVFLSVPLMALANAATVPADRQAMTAANRLYQAGHYGEAIQLYEGLVARGSNDSRVLYNLGNAYYQQGDVARSRAAYESAARLAPRDADIRYNLDIAHGQAGVTSSAEKDTSLSALAAVAGFSRRWLSIDELAVLTLGAWLLFGMLAVTYRSFPAGQRPAALRYAAASAMVLVVLAAVPLSARLLVQAPLPTSLTGAAQAGLSHLPLGL